MRDDERTRAYYDENAARVSAEYERVNMRPTVDAIAAYLEPGSRVLELGAGSGRDAAYLLARGFEVTATDASPAMAEQARSYHPELEGRLEIHRLPSPLPFADAAFEAVISLATLMHLHESDLPPVLAECRRVSVPGGILAISVPTERADVGAEGRDPRGRRFTVLSAERWRTLFSEAGFECAASWSQEDAAGRAGVRWETLIAVEV